MQLDIRLEISQRRRHTALKNTMSKRVLCFATPCSIMRTATSAGGRVLGGSIIEGIVRVFVKVQGRDEVKNKGELKRG